MDELLRETGLGKSSHFSLFGPPGMGKSSLLNGVVEIASQRNLLPVRLELREATVESPLSFYGAVFNSALEELIRLTAIERNGSLMTGWIAQTLGGETGISLDLQPLEIGVLLSAKMNGKMVGEIPTAVLQRDLSTLLSLAGGVGVRGIVLCLDAAEALDDNADLAPGLMEVANAFPRLSLVTAASKSGRLQAAAPRAWTQIEVGRFEDASAVFSAITMPLADAKESDLSPKISTAREIFSLTDGQPYEVNLVSHFIWEAISRGEQSEFELSQTVLEQVMQELEEKGRHEASPAISHIRGLTSQDLELAGKYAPYEGLTTKQLALLRLMLEPYDEERLVAAESDVQVDLQRLATLGVVTLHGDRFELAGGSDARLYLRYASERRVGKKIGYGDTYARKATAVCRQSLCDRLFGEESEDHLLMGRWARREVVDGAGGEWLQHISSSVENGNLSALVELFPEFTDSDILASFAENGGVLFGFVLQVGLQSVEYADIGINFEGLTTDEARERVEAWLAEHEDLFRKYEISVDAWCAVCMSAGAGRAAAAYSELWRHGLWCYYMFKAGATEDAMIGLSDAVNRAQSLLGDAPTDPLLRARLADALNRVGFMQASSSEFEKAQATLEASQDLAASENWLTQFNLAYIRASLGDLSGAVECIENAVERFDLTEGEFILCVWFPTPDEWSTDVSMASVVVIPGGWVERFVDLQRKVIVAAADGSQENLREALDGLALASPPGLLRLAAWAEFSILGRAERAVELFDRAVHSTDLADVDAVNAELDFVKGQDRST